MTVTSTPQQAGSWNWISSNEAHWRPATYWQPGTRVAVGVDVNSVAAGNGTYGQLSVSHGCIGMSDADAAWLFGTVKVGDPVVVGGTTRGLEAGNGWTDWNVTFDQWKTGSALAG